MCVSHVASSIAVLDVRRKRRGTFLKIFGGKRLRI